MYYTSMVLVCNIIYLMLFVTFTWDTHSDHLEPSPKDNQPSLALTIPGTPDNSSSDTKEESQPTHNSITRHAYLGMIIRARRRRRLQRRKRPITCITKSTQTITPTHTPSADPELVSHDPTPPHPTDTSSEDSTDLYFRAYATHRPEMGESNAESVLRAEQIEQDVQRMRQKRESKKAQGKRRQPKITLHDNVQEINLTSEYHLYPN
jgi:hypothetical protein